MFSRLAEGITLRDVHDYNIVNFFEQHVIYKIDIVDHNIFDRAHAFQYNKIYHFSTKHRINGNITPFIIPT